MSFQQSLGILRLRPPSQSALRIAPIRRRLASGLLLSGSKRAKLPIQSAAKDTTIPLPLLLPAF